MAYVNQWSSWVQEEKWLMHYSSLHQILLVGEGDFSFALCLAKAFGSASNIVATSLDSYDALITNYKKAKSNLKTLKKLGASLMHEVDATKLIFNTDLRMWKFDRIIYNFPHAGFYGKEDGFHVLRKHRELVSEFFRNARCLLGPCGEIHVSHKTTSPFDRWDIPGLASLNSLMLIYPTTDFRIEHFPGYANKRGSGNRCDESFPLRECCTFKFKIESSSAMEMSETRNWESTPSQTLQTIPIQRNLSSYDWETPWNVPVYADDNLPQEHTGQGFDVDVNLQDEFCFDPWDWLPNADQDDVFETEDIITIRSNLHSYHRVKEWWEH